MGRISGKIIGSIAGGGALTIGGLTTLSQMDQQTDEINSQVAATDVVIETIIQDNLCYESGECKLVLGTDEEYRQKIVEFLAKIEDFGQLADNFNATCTGKKIKKSDEQKCIDMNNKAVAETDAIMELAEDLDARIN
jgi:hypothetical protein